MHRFLIRIPFWVRWMFPRYTWRIPTHEKVLYLTFDDGPHPVATPFVLEQLARYQAKATFFCIGKNVLAHPNLYQRLQQEGHAIGNHTHNHPNGASTPTGVYLADVRKAAGYIDTNLFRPPYGRINKRQAAGIAAAMNRSEVKIVMWEVLSADFDQSITPEQCLRNVVRHAGPGSVIVFHDSQKALENLRFALPKVLAHFADLGYRFESIKYQKK